MWADYVTGLRAPAGEWATVIPLTLRNVGQEPVSIREVRYASVEGLEVSEWRMVGPLSPSLGNAAYVGWITPTLQFEGVPLDGLRDSAPVDGFVIPTADAEPSDSSVPNDGLASDESNDASPLLKVRRSAGSEIGTAAGLYVEFEAGGELYSVSYPDSELILCSEEAYNADRCNSNGR